MLKDEVLEYVRKRSEGRMAASAPGVGEALGIPLTEASAALAHLEAERKIERVHPRLQVFKLVGAAIEAGILVKDDNDDGDTMEEVVVSQDSVGESVTAIVIADKTEKEEDMPKVSFDRTEAAWERIRSSKSFANLGLKTVGDLLGLIDQAGGVKEALKISTKGGGVNVFFRSTVAENLIGLREHMAELDKLPPPEPPEGRGRPRTRKVGESLPVKKRSGPKRSEIEPTTFRHRRKKVLVRTRRETPQPPVELSPSPMDLLTAGFWLAELRGKRAVGLRSFVQCLEGVGAAVEAHEEIGGRPVPFSELEEELVDLMVRAYRLLHPKEGERARNPYE